MNQTEQKANVPEMARQRRSKILYSRAVVVQFGLFAFQLVFHAVRTRRISRSGVVLLRAGKNAKARREFEPDILSLK
jgi:hypothetical protein